MRRSTPGVEIAASGAGSEGLDLKFTPDFEFCGGRKRRRMPV
jgi:hypothetical protein